MFSECVLELASHQKPKYEHVFVTGSGAGLTLVPSVNVVCMYFHKYRYLAVPIAHAGVPVGTFLYAPFITYLKEEYGWRGAVLLFSGFTLHLLVLSALWTPLDNTTINKTLEDEDAIKVKESTTRALDWRLFMNLSYLVFLVSNLLGTLGHSIVTVHLGAYAESLGLSAHQGAWLFSAMGIGGVLGRIGGGILAQTRLVTMAFFLSTSTLMAGFTCVIMPLVAAYDYLFGLSVVFGILFTQYVIIGILLLTELQEIRLLNMAFGFTTLIQGIGYTAGGPIAGKSLERISQEVCDVFYMALKRVLSSESQGQPISV